MYKKYEVETTHIKEADLSLIQINARLESRIETLRWWLRITISLLLGVLISTLFRLILVIY